MDLSFYALQISDMCSRRIPFHQFESETFPYLKSGPMLGSRTQMWSTYRRTLILLTLRPYKSFSNRESWFCGEVLNVLIWFFWRPIFSIYTYLVSRMLYCSNPLFNSFFSLSSVVRRFSFTCYYSWVLITATGWAHGLSIIRFLTE